MKPIPSAASASFPTAEIFPPSAQHGGNPAPPSGGTPKNNRRNPNLAPVYRLYPWLLLASTATAAAFCILYINKPVIAAEVSAAAARPAAAALSPAAKAPPEPAPVSPAKSEPALFPQSGGLPGEKTAHAHESAALPRPPLVDTFEETNLSVQHILTAKAPGNHIHRINLDVPVLFQSRNLRWTAEETEEARVLLGRLTDFQEKSRQLREEGSHLLGEWNSLVNRSLPLDQLRADSPSLPSNQSDKPAGPVSAGKPAVQLETK